MEINSNQPLKPQILDESILPFAKDIVEGLKSTPKYLPSKYFYDSTGDELFCRIMELDEYYLTRTETKIIEQEKDAISSYFISHVPFRIIELGAGDGFKTKILLRHLNSKEVIFEYIPIDISKNAIEKLTKSLWSDFKNIKIFPLVGDYFDILTELKSDLMSKKVILFLGSNIGNFNDNEAHKFLDHLYDVLNTNDLLFIGFDLKKDPKLIHDAYNDKNGVTKDFNFNLLHRINDTLQANFNVHNFIHYPTYDPQSGECRSYIMSTKNQIVKLDALNEQIALKKWEPIHMETSKKYDDEEIAQLAHSTGFTPIAYFYDENHFFVDAIWQKGS